MTDNLQEFLQIDLPEEIWIHIFRYLDIKSKQNAELVCKKWLNFILNDVILSGEYTLGTNYNISSSQVNAILAKRKKLKTVRFPRLLYRTEDDYDEEHGFLFDIRNVNLKVCKDLKKVILRVKSQFVKLPQKLPEWVHLRSFCFDPHNEPATFGPEHVVELELSIVNNIDKDNSVDSSLESVLKHMSHLEKLSVCFSRDYQDNTHFWLPILSGLQHSPNLHELDLKISGNQSSGYINNLRTLLGVIALSCPNITCLKLGRRGCTNDFYPSELEWCSIIKYFDNLEKLEIDIYFYQASRSRFDDYDPFVEMVQSFIDNPMPKMKELKLCAINAFFQDEFLSNLPLIFPNLETFNLVELGQQGFTDKKTVETKKLSYWRMDTILDVLNSLGSIKNLSLPTMEMVLASINDLGEHNKSVHRTEHVFCKALDIIEKYFPLSLGNLKITDNKYGFVILKEKMKPPKMFNQKEIGGRQILESEHIEDRGAVRLKLRPRGRKRKRGGNKNHNKDEEIVLSGELIKSLYEAHIAKSSKYAKFE